MRAIKITDSETGSKLEICQRPPPEPKPNEVLIKIHAAGINRPDIMQRKGLYPPPEGASDILGLEVAGTIAAFGSPSTHLNIGDQVCALVTGGGYAEYSTAPTQLCLPIPDSLSFTQAAALPETYFTVWSNVFDRTHLKAGEILLVHGGSSGIGTTAIQLAKAFGATVIVTAGSQEKCQFCIELGADLAIREMEKNNHPEKPGEMVKNHFSNDGIRSTN